jgi:formate dehydrogenase subunit gamma
VRRHLHSPCEVLWRPGKPRGRRLQTRVRARGAALISSPHFRVAPQWYLDIVQGFFGARANTLTFHIAVGVTWIVVFLVYGTVGFHAYLAKEVLQREIGLDHDDLAWLKIRTLRLLNLADDPLPPQGVYNAGQKLFSLLVYAMIPVIMATGLIMAFHFFSTTAVQWTVVLHFVAVGLVVSGLMIHVYMGAVFPEEKPAFFSMITGTFNELYGYRHHFKWWREMKIQEAEWEQNFVKSSRTTDAAVSCEQASSVAPEVSHPLESKRGVIRSVLARAFRHPEY